MRRGTTPIIKLKLTGITLETLKDVYVTFSQCGYELTKTGDEVETDIENGVIKVFLTEEDTLKFKPHSASVQIRATTQDGNAIASSIKQINIGDVLYEEAITKGE